MHAMQAAESAAAVEWIDKEAVAKILKISERTVLSLVGKITSKKQRNPESNQMVWMFDAVAVDRYAFFRDNPQEREPRPKADAEPAAETQQEKQPDRGTVTQALQTAQPTALQFLQALLSASPVSQSPAPVPASPWLTISESAEYIRLPAGVLIALIKRGKLPALRTSARQDLHRYLVCRRDLDAIQGESQGEVFDA